MTNYPIKSWELFDLTQSQAGPLLRELVFPWAALSRIHDLILELGPQLPKEDYEQLSEDVWVAKDCKIAATACIGGPAIIGHETDIRPGAYIRTNALVGDHAVVGNSTELKNVILFNRVQVPHYNYVGDSILGYQAHMGAGAITSNVKGDRSQGILRLGTDRIETGLKKLGALIGDGAEIGCNSVLNPGSIIGRNTQVYPLTMVRGLIPPNCIYKQTGEIVAKVTT